MNWIPLGPSVVFWFGKRTMFEFQSLADVLQFSVDVRVVSPMSIDSLGLLSITMNLRSFIAFVLPRLVALARLVVFPYQTWIPGLAENASSYHQPWSVSHGRWLIWIMPLLILASDSMARLAAVRTISVSPPQELPIIWKFWFYTIELKPAGHDPSYFDNCQVNTFIELCHLLR